MTSDSVKLDDDGIPILENPVTPQQLVVEATPPPPDFGDHEVIAELLRHSSIQDLLDDMSEDLQKLVSWKIEELLKDRMNLMIRQATEECAPKLVEDIRTQLQLALPGLLANMIEQARSSGSR
jgi:hypothetical protein